MWPASSSPASSWRKCPAPWIIGWSMPWAPRICSRKIGRHRAGDRIAVAEGHQHRRRAVPTAPPRRARLASAAGIVRAWSAPAGHRPRARAVGVVGERRVVGRAHLGGHRAAGSRTATNRPTSTLGRPGSPCGTATRSRAWRSHRSAGRCWRRRRGEAVRVLGDQPQPDQPAPVLADQGDAAQVEDVEGQRAHPLDVAGVGVVLAARSACRSGRIRPDRDRSTRCPAATRIGIILRYRKDQVGSPCSSSTGSA